MKNRYYFTLKNKKTGLLSYKIVVAKNEHDARYLVNKFFKEYMIIDAENIS